MLQGSKTKNLNLQLSVIGSVESSRALVFSYWNIKYLKHEIVDERIDKLFDYTN